MAETTGQVKAREAAFAKVKDEKARRTGVADARVLEAQKIARLKSLRMDKEDADKAAAAAEKAAEVAAKPRRPRTTK